MYWPAGVTLLQNAFMLALWVSLPLLGGIAVAGLAGSFLQSSVGLSDQAGLIALKLLVAGIVFVFFSAWMFSMTANYWGTLWLSAAALVGVR